MASQLPQEYQTTKTQLLLTAGLSGAAAAAAVITALVLLAGVLWPVLPYLAVAVEGGFAVVFFRKAARLNRVPAQHMPTEHDGWTHFEKFLDTGREGSRYTDITDILSRWFGGVPFSEIKRDNAADLLTYGFFYKSREQLILEGRPELAGQLVDAVEEAWGVRIPLGFNPSLRCMTHLWQPLKYHYRPAIFYIAGEFLALLKHIMLLACGFRCRQARGLTYYTYRAELLGQPGSNAAAGCPRQPILFLHGVGLGLLPYIPFVMRLASTGHPVIAVEFRHLSMRWYHDNPPVPEVVSGVVYILDRHGVEGACVVGHSYGTMMASQLVQTNPERVQSLCLIDPVCFCMFTGHLIKNFVYKAPRSLADVVSMTTWVIARDLHTAAAVSRGFFWTELNLWSSDMPSQSMVVLSEYDSLVPIANVRKMLRRETQATVLHHPSHMHADFIADPKWQDEVAMEVLQTMHGMLGHCRSDSVSSYIMDGLVAGATGSANGELPPPQQLLPGGGVTVSIGADARGVGGAVDVTAGDVWKGL